MTRLFDLLLRLLPAAVRQRYRRDMLATFETRLEAARPQGRLAVARLVARECFDLLSAAAAARRPDRGNLMASPAPPPASKSSMAGLSLDIRWAWRMFRRQPGFTAASVATLALGIGANAAVFSVLHAVLLAPLSFPDPDRLVALFYGTPAQARGTHSPVALRDYQDRLQSFSAVGIFDTYSVVAGSAGAATERIDGVQVSEGFFPAVGLAAIRGRVLNANDVRENAARVVISHTLWQRRFGGSDVVGSLMSLDERPHEIVGVLAPAAFPARVDFWVPLVLTASDLRPSQRGAHYLQAVARLRPGVTLDHAQADADRVTAELAAEFPNYHEGTVFAVVPLRDALTERARPALVALAAAVILLLVVAVANVANLLLARSMTRRAEIALRASLGASRQRIARQFIAESVLLSAAGAAVGLLVATWATRPLLAIAPAALPSFANVQVHAPVVLVTLAVSLVIGLLFGMVPALIVAGRNTAAVMREGNEARAAGGARRRFRRALVIAEIAVAVVLLVGAVLLIRTAANLQRVELGFDPEDVTTFRLTLPASRASSADAVINTYNTVLDEIRTVPGVASAGLAFGAPFSRANPFTSFALPGRPSETESSTRMRVVWGDYFSTLRIPLRQGRVFDRRDTAAAPLVAIVNESFVRTYLAGGPAIGQTVQLHASLMSGAPRGPRTIVGVVADVRQQQLTSAPEPDVFIPYGQHPLNQTLVVLRTSGTPLALAQSLQARLYAIDANLPIAQMATMTSAIGETTARQRLAGTLLNVFAVLAAVLAAIGLYGALAFDVAQRRREIGVRVALGAARASVLRLFVEEAMGMALIGTALGVAGALALGRYLESLLFNVSPSDPWLIAAAAAGMLAVAFLASLLPARRATTLDPIQVLR